MRNEPLWLVAIDPALRHTGIATCQVIGYDQIVPGALRTVSPDPDRESSIVEQADFIRSWVRHELAVADYVVIEHPSQHFARGRRTGAHSIFQKGIGYGAVLAAASSRFRGFLERITTVAVSTWYPSGPRGGKMRKADLVRAIRDRFAEHGKLNEHQCMALGLALWWSRNVAPRVWQDIELRQSVSRETG